MSREVFERLQVGPVELPNRLALAPRISADEKTDGMLGIDSAIELARRVENLGVDILPVVTGSACDSPPWYYQHMACHRDDGPGGVCQCVSFL